MIRAALLLFPLAAQAETAPSGRDLHLFDQQTSEQTTHLRYSTPAPLSYEAVADDFAWACASHAAQIVTPEVVVVITDKELPFGETDPTATQFFELFDLKDGACQWRAF